MTQHRFDLASSHEVDLLAERPWLRFYPPSVPASLEYPRGNLPSLLATAASDFPHHLACTLLEQRLTYHQLYDQVCRVAHGLQHAGVRENTAVGVLLPNVPEYLVTLFAVWSLGGHIVQLSPLYVPEEIERLLELTECRYVVTLDLFTPHLSLALQRQRLERVFVISLAERLPVFKSLLYRIERLRKQGHFHLVTREPFVSFPHLLDYAPRDSLGAHGDLDALAILAPTGGTTGSPKIVMLSHRNLLCNAWQLRAWSLAHDGQERILGVLPLFHAYGLTVCALAGIAMRASIHLHPRFETHATLQLIHRWRPTIFPAVPAMLAALNRVLRHWHDRASRPDLSSIRTVISGASALDSAIREEFARYGAQGIIEGYGLTEAGPVTHANPLVPEYNRPGTIGIPLPDTEARIVDALDGSTELPVGEVGELIVRGPQVMLGYWRNPTETALALRHGWLYTGDLARRDADGYFTIVDRKRDIIKTSGFLVYPAEVEEVILRFPQVAEAAVIGEPDPQRGEVVVAYVVPREGQLDLKALDDFCDEHLAKYKRPRKFHIVPQLPKNFLGKVLRRRLRQS
ncbi:MAG: long-chain fatty acid--CoA ligase [Gemmatales bacterium]|nr:long-chain fatty acid--CoA ligase [Gemmatales bacterium]MDW7995437.1 long-chain fatty acid--CoA ligase [Gemmatales bacterium]